MAMLERGRRTTCGTRMNDLIGEAAEMDKAFWDSAVWAEGDEDSENDSFDENEEEVKPDMFDSDFNDTETDESDEDEEGQLKAQRRRERSSAAKTGGGYKEPVKPARPESGPAASSTSPKEKKRAKTAKAPADTTALDPLSVTLRQSTQSRSTARSHELLSAKVQARPRVVRPPIPKKEYSQRDLLLEALQTEAVNFKWLKSQQMAEEERNRLEAKAVKPTNKVARTLLSSRKANTITFVDDDAWPALFRAGPRSLQTSRRACGARSDDDSDDNEERERQQPATSLVCAVTGQPARYRDPLTRLPYFDAAAFRHLREAHRLAQQLQEQQAAALAASSSKRVSSSSSSSRGSAPPPPPLSSRAGLDSAASTAAPAAPGKVPKKRGRKSKAQLLAEAAAALPAPQAEGGEEGAGLGGAGQA